MSRPHGSPYDEAERLYCPPDGTYDPEWVARMVAEREPRIGWDRAYRLSVAAWRHLWASPQLSPDDLAAYVALDEPSASERQVAAAVASAVDFCEAFAVEPPRSVAETSVQA